MLPIGTAGISAVDTCDIAEAAAISLTEHGHDGQTYNLVNPTLIDGPGNAALWSNALGRPIQYTGHEFDAWEQQMSVQLPGWIAYDMRMMPSGLLRTGLCVHASRRRSRHETTWSRTSHLSDICSADRRRLVERRTALITGKTITGECNESITVNDYGAPLHLGEIPTPTPGPGQVLVENHSLASTGSIPAVVSVSLRQVFPLQFPWIPGGDVAGRVAAGGEGVTSFEVRDEVFGYTREAGAYAEFVVVNAIRLAHRSAAVPAEVAAGAALVSQTALQMLQLAKVKAGQTLLILGASGGVGSLAV
jgi:hypothetical protein